MLILGVVLILIGWLAGITVLFWIGAVLAVVGLVLLVVPSVTGGRRLY